MRIHFRNVPVPGREPRLVHDPRQLPIPIDTFQLPQVRLRERGHAAALPDGLGFWVSLGPAVERAQIAALAAAEGLEGFRINVRKFASHAALSHYIRDVAELRRGQSMCLDLSGREVRVRGLTEISGQSFIHLLAGDGVAVVDSITAHEDGSLDPYFVIPVDAPVSSLGARPGEVIFMSDGWLQLRVDAVGQGRLLCRSLHDCRMLDDQSVNLPGMFDDRNPVLDIDAGIFSALGDSLDQIDFFALSFTNRGEDVDAFRDLLRRSGIAGRVVAKIETRTGVANAAAIAAKADAVMIARGDLAVQLAPAGEDIVVVEDHLRAVCRVANVPCIVATRVADSLEGGGDALTDLEVARLAHELAQERPLTLMLAQETLHGATALRNYEIVLRTVRRLLPHAPANG